MGGAECSCHGPGPCLVHAWSTPGPLERGLGPAGEPRASREKQAERSLRRPGGVDWATLHDGPWDLIQKGDQVTAPRDQWHGGRVSREGATPRRATPHRATPHRAGPHRAGPHRATPGHATPGHATLRQATPHWATPGHATQGCTTQGHATPGHAGPHGATRGHATQGHATQGRATPGHTGPHGEAPGWLRRDQATRGRRRSEPGARALVQLPRAVSGCPGPGPGDLGRGSVAVRGVGRELRALGRRLCA